MKNTMELVDRYLQAVGFWLPRQQRQDIVKELSEDLRSQIEEKETELGRKLNEPEVECMLKLRGRPMLVANHYLPQRYLIGPLLFPIYRLVLIIVGLCYLAPWILVAIGLMVYGASYRTEHIHAGWMQGIFSIWSSFWLTAFIAIGVVTLVFAVLERVNARQGFLQDWEPRKLPPVRDPHEIKRISSTVEAAALLAFLIWWISGMSSVTVVNAPGVQITLAPVWRYFFWSFLGLALLLMCLSATNLMRPYWTRLRASLRLALDLAGSALFCWMLKAHLVAGITVANTPVARTAEIVSQINLWAERAFPVAVIVGVVILGVNVFRIIRVGNTGPGSTAARGAPAPPAGENHGAGLIHADGE